MSQPPRRLTILDLTLLVGFAALALAGFQFATTRIFPGWLDYSRWPDWIENPAIRTTIYMFSDATAPLIPVAAGWTGLLLVQRSIPPRPSWRQIARQPGMAACFAVVLAFAWVVLCTGVLLLMMWLFSFDVDPLPLGQSMLLGHVFPLVGLSVAAAWFQLLLSRRWRPPRDWIDRAGRVVGVLWIVIGLIWTLRSYETLW